MGAIGSKPAFAGADKIEAYLWGRDDVAAPLLRRYRLMTGGSGDTELYLQGEGGIGDVRRDGWL